MTLNLTSKEKQLLTEILNKSCNEYIEVIRLMQDADIPEIKSKHLLEKQDLQLSILSKLLYLK